MWPPHGHTMLQCVTYSGHTPFVIPDELKKVHFSNAIPERLRHYMEVANYTDRAIGDFVRLLKASGQYDNTTIIITGDHEGIGVDRATFIKTRPWPPGSRPSNTCHWSYSTARCQSATMPLWVK